MKLNHISRLFLILTAFCLSAALLAADDGSWSASFDISGGSVYSENDVDDIILEKELLIFTGETTEAHFQFRNSSGRDVVLDCGFPVIHRIDAFLGPDGAEIPVSKYGGNEIPSLAFFRTVPNQAAIDAEDIEVYPELVPDNEFNNSREFIGPDIPESAGIIFSISQDGNKVEVSDVLLERRVEDDSISLTFHFRHKLRFPARSATSVSVVYSQDLLYGNEGSSAGDVYRWNYVIGTGSTWNGPIGELFFVKPSSWSGDVAGLRELSLDTGVDICYASRWEPSRSQEFTLGSVPVEMSTEYSLYSEMDDIIPIWKGGMSRMKLPDAPAQDFVKNVRASSELSDEIDVFLENGMRASAGFRAVSAFDGFEETSWSENAGGIGTGEFLEAELSLPVAGIVVRNGFKRMPFDDWVYNTGFFDNWIRDDKSGFRDYFSLNGRVRTLEIINSAGDPVAQLDLEDLRDRQIFYGLDLQAGRYRFAVKDAYRGTKWEDTCIADILFIPKDAGPVEKLYTDPFYSSVFGIRKYK